MLNYLKYGIVLSALTATFAGHAKEITIDCDPSLTACGISFTTIPATPSDLASGDDVTSDPYIITNVGSTSVTLTSVNLVRQSDDTVGASGLSIDPSSTCTASTVLASSATCEIVLDFTPAYGGLLDWNLVVTPQSTQRPLSLNISTTVTGPSAPNSKIIVGSYTDSSSQYPMAATSTDGVSWTYVFDDTSTLPNTFDTTAGQDGFSDGICILDTCIAIGDYTSTDGNYYPMIASNAGGSWSYVVQNTQAPSDISTNGALMTSVNCYQSLCLATGNYYDESGTLWPLAYRSTNGGNTWTLVLDSSNAATYGVILPTQVQCTELNTSTCFATIQKGTNAGAMLAISSTGTWSVVDPGVIGLGYVLGLLDCPTSLSCVGVAIQYSGLKSARLDNDDLIIYSTDGGNSWSQTDLVGDMLPNPSDSTSVTALGCAENGECVFAGTYQTGGNSYLWASIGTLGADFTDTAPVIDLSSNPSDFDDDPQMFNATCTQASSTQCMITGDYTSTGAGNPQYPFIGLIVDGTPSYPVSSSTLPTNYGTFGFLIGIECDGLNCVASGQYDLVSSAQTPLAVTSTDGGTTWSYSVEDGDQLPPDLTAGFFTSYRYLHSGGDK